METIDATELQTRYLPALGYVAAVGHPVVALKHGRTALTLRIVVRSGTTYSQYELKGTVVDVSTVEPAPGPGATRLDKERGQVPHQGAEGRRCHLPNRLVDVRSMGGAEVSPSEAPSEMGAVGQRDLGRNRLPQSDSV